MKKLHLILMCLFALVSTTSFAQYGNLQDVIYLKNGSIIRGMIIESVPNQSYKIKTSDGSVFAYTVDEVSKLTKEEPYNQKKNSYNKKSPGYFGAVEFGYSIGVGDWGTDRVDLNIINGYQFNPYLIVGGIIGLRYYNEAEGLSVPIMGYIRANFIDGKIVPYASLSAGYNADLSGDGADGLIIEPSLGVAFDISKRNALTFSLGYSATNFKIYYDYFGNISDYYHKNSSAVTIKLGITF